MKKWLALICLAVVCSASQDASAQVISEAQPLWAYRPYYHGYYPGYTAGVYPAYDYGVSWETTYFPHHYNGYVPHISRMRQSRFYNGY